MKDWKLIISVVLGSTLVLLGVIWGLSKMASPTSEALKVDETVLLNGARFIKENGETKVTMVTFSDMQCPSCKRAHSLTAELFNKPGVKVVVRHFPLPPQIHKHALISAKAAEAARIMDKGWEMIDVLYSKQDEWANVAKPEEKFTQYAKELGLDEDLFKEKLNSAEVAANVKVDADLAAGLRLSGTPTIFVNGEQVGADFVVEKVNGLLSAK
jgi:protein-disulfide isomerase